MKIQGPKGPKAPGVDGPDKTAETAGEAGKFVDKLGGPSGPGAPGGPGGADPIAALAQKLEAGGISGKQALEKLLDMASTQGALAALPEAVQKRLRAQLEELVKEDAFLSAKAKRLGMTEE